jgi:hypothetical protein
MPLWPKAKKKRKAPAAKKPRKKKIK